MKCIFTELLKSRMDSVNDSDSPEEQLFKLDAAIDWCENVGSEFNLHRWDEYVKYLKDQHASVRKHCRVYA